jgi:SAM-dependent methyltransferase
LASARDIRARVRRLVPPSIAARLRRRHAAAWPPVGLGRRRIGRSTEPVSRVFGFDRGQPVDRHYVEAFLRRHAGDLRGAVLEVGEDLYARRVGGWTGTGGAGAIRTVDVLDVTADNPRATIVADLAAAEHVEGERFDCIVCTQTLLLVYDVRAAVATLHRLLKPGGVLLVTVPGLSRICRPEPGETWEDHWRFTSSSVRRLLEDAFGEVAVEAYGNVLSASAFLYGLAASELTARELDLRDPDYEVTIGARAVKGPARTAATPP